MTNKNLWAKIIAVVAIVCLLTCFFVACGDKDKDPSKKEPEKKPTPADPVDDPIDVLTPLLTGIQKGVASGKLSDFVVSANLDLTTQNGDATSKYAVKFDLDLNLFDGTNEVSKTWLKTEIVKKGATEEVLLGLYYKDNSKPNEGMHAIDNGRLYMQYKSAGAQKKLAFPIPNVNGTMNALDGTVDMSGPDLSTLDLASAAGGVAAVIAPLLDITSETEFALDLGALLDPNNPDNITMLLEGVGDYFDALGLDLKGEDIGSIIPQIRLTLKPKYAADGALEDLTVELGVKTKDIVINRKGGEPLIMVGLGEQNIKLTAVLDYAINKSINQYGVDLTKPTDLEAFTLTDLLNLSIDAGFTVSAPINLDINPKLGIRLAAGDYTLKIRLAADPTQVVRNLFKYVEATEFTADTTYYTRIFDETAEGSTDDTGDEVYDDVLYKNAKIDTAAKFAAATEPLYTREYALAFTGADGKFDLSATLKSVGSILSCVKAAEIDLTDGTLHPLQLLIGIDSEENMQGSIKADLLVNIQTGEPALPGLSGLPLVDLLASLEGLLPGLIGTDANAEDAKTMALLETIGGYLAGAFIGINADAIDTKYADGLYAKVDIEKIPFSGYTAFKGEYNSKYVYYTRNPIEYEVQDTTNGFENGVTSFTKEGETYVPVSDPENKGPQPGVTYYKEKITYTKANITAFEEGTTYYVAGTDVDPTKGFGIGINAEVKVNPTDKVKIIATVKGMDVFGLSETLSVTISGTHFGLFDYAVPTWEDLQATYGV